MKTKAEYRDEFRTYCLNNKKNKELQQKEAERIWLEYKPTKIDIYKKTRKRVIENKVDAMNQRNQFESKARVPKTISEATLNLSNPISALLLTIYLSLMVILSSVDIMLVLLIGIPILIFILILLFSVIFPCLMLYIATTKYRYYEKNDFDSNEVINEYRRTFYNFKKAYKSSRFNNGNIKWGVFETKVNQWYKNEVVLRLNNPFKVQTKKVRVDSKNFITSGGVYAWWHDDEVVYIGKANNFKRRMNEHTAGLLGQGFHNEYKYNSGLTINDVYIQILAITDDIDEQSVLESYYFDNYDNGKLLNSTGTLSWKKIMMQGKYRIAWENIQQKNEQYSDVEKMN